MKKAYYARPISIDDTPQMDRDLELIRKLGFEPYPIGEKQKEILSSYKKEGMSVFKTVVQECDCLVFRSFPDGSIGAGVAQEIGWADEINIPVVEFARQINRRTISMENTREMLAELGQR